MTAVSPENWFATCPKGVESLLAGELATLGATATRETVAGVHFDGPRASAYRACLWSRLANRILWPLATVPGDDGEQLYRAIREIDWPALFAPDCSIAVDFIGTNRALRNTQYGAQRCKDAVVDRFVQACGRRPTVDRVRPDVRINVRLARSGARVSIDLAGNSLHQRGYRQSGGAAPLKENLAAAILLRADWPGIAARGGALIDPMCGAATLLLEGALMAADIAPGLGRQHFGFSRLHMHDSAQWAALLAEARGRAERGRLATLPEIRGYDADPKAIRAAVDNIARAGLQQVVRVSCKPLADFARPTHRTLEHGLVLTNPPYGERLGRKSELGALYQLLGRRLHAEFAGWQAAVFTSDLELGRAIGLRSHKRYTLYNGAIPSHLLLFELIDNELREPVVAAVEPDEPDEPDQMTPGAQMFGNRLRKNRRQLQSWLRREGITCYRLYDADMPEYAVAVDVYGDHVHVAEYRAPQSVPEETARRRMQEVMAALPEALGVPAGHIACKQRRRQRGASQYQRQARRNEELPVREGQAELLVNLHDYLDTGLFLDHRPLRLRLAAEARDRDFLNLFCYTGSATVHAALGGARSTTSVDSSNTYLDWLRRNLARNGLEGAQHRLVRADCLRWLQDERAEQEQGGKPEGRGEQAGQYDLILLDPPSFSNSRSRDESFDVQRDHVPLVRAAMRLLRADGQLYFSNNLRGFVLDTALATAYRVEDISASTIDRDFARRRRVHQCWSLRHLPSDPNGRRGQLQRAR